MILAVTGHRPPKVGGYEIPNPVFNAIVRSMDEMLMRLQPHHVYTGMALGVDQWVAGLCIDNQIPFTAILPFAGYDSKWPDESRRAYNFLMGHATAVRTLAPAPPDGASVDGLVRHRNRYLVREAEALMAVFNGEAHSGTAQTISYALQLRRPTYIAEIPPHLWAMARTRWEQIEARRQFREAQNRVETVASFERRLHRNEGISRRYSPEFQAEQEAFADPTRFARVANEANAEKKVEKAKEDVANLRPRRMIDVGDD